MIGAVASVAAVALGVVAGAVVTWRATTRRRDRYWSTVDESPAPRSGRATPGS